MAVASHLESLFDTQKRKAVITRIAEALSSIAFDAVAVCGASGMLISGSVCDLLDKELILVRKNETRYSKFRVEFQCWNDTGWPSSGKFIILDDLICSGDTLKYMLSSIKHDCPQLELVGAYMWLTRRYYSKRELSLINTLKSMFNQCDTTNQEKQENNVRRATCTPTQEAINAIAGTNSNT